MLVIAIASIGGTFAIVQGLNLDYDYKSSSVGAGTMLAGNVKVIQFGPDGTIKAYRQTDNHIVKQGMEIIMSQVFGGMNSSATYPRFFELTGSHPVRYMQIGTGANLGRLLYNDTNINSPIAAPCGRTLATIDNSTIANDGPAHGYSLADGSDIVGSPAPLCGEAGGGTQDCSAQMNVTARAQFFGGAPTGPGAGFCATNGIDEAGIFDNSTSTSNGDLFNGGLMFARNTFGSVDLGPLDTLQLDWEFTFTDS